jgi:L-serine dehydratase
LLGAFDIIGPVMIGPSSSHTAGAARLGKMARTILGEDFAKAVIKLYGSFARTYLGHGTDRALVAGLLGYSAADSKIRDALEIASATASNIIIEVMEEHENHPNTAELIMTGVSGKTVRVKGASVGGGNIIINQIDDYQVELTGDYHTLIARYHDKPGVIALITGLLAKEDINIAFMRVSRRQRGDQALMILEADQAIPARALPAILASRNVFSALLVPPL